MAGLKVNKKVAKELKIDDTAFEIDDYVDKDDKNVNRGVDNDSSNVDIGDDFGDITSSIDEVEDGDDAKSFEDAEDIDEKDSKKGKFKIIAVGGVILIVLAVGIVAIIGSKGVKDEDMSQPGGVVIDEEMINEDSTVDAGTDGEEVVDDSLNTDDGVKKENKVVYENAMLGLALKYPSNWYVEERADVLLNMVQSTNVNGNIDLLTTEVKLAGVIMDFSARDDLGTKISLGVSPLVISGDTQIANVESLSDILNVGTASQIDEQIKKNVESGGGSIIELKPSEVKAIGNYEVIQSAYQFEKNGIKMDVIQMLVPYGVNNIVLTATSKVGDNPINREEVLIGMLGSLGKVGEVELDVLEENSDEVESNGNTESTDAVNNGVNNVDNGGTKPKEEGVSN